MVVAQQKEKEKQQDLSSPPLEPLFLLQLIKDAQQKHGLRRADYQRYRGYCARRVRRIRKSLGFTNIHKSIPKHPAKFIPKKVTIDVANEQRYLQILLFDAERCWAYAMQFKQEAGEDPHSRKRFHVIMKLKRAVKHTTMLDSIAKSGDRTDAATKLEAQAYNAWMHGSLFFELKHWETAMEHLRTAMKIYKKLAEVTSVGGAAHFYELRCREIQPQLRYCEFNCTEDISSDAAVSEMISMRLKLGEDDSFQDEFDKLISELRTKAIHDQPGEIIWGGKKLSTTDTGIKQLLQSLEHFGSQLQLASSHDDKISQYEQLLSKTRDVIQAVNDEAKKKLDSQQFPAQNFLPFLDFVRLSKTVDRYILIVKSTLSQTKKVRPQDLIRLYDSIIESCKEIAGLPSADEQIIEAYRIKSEYYRAFRCFYLANAYADHSKWEESIALCDFAASLAKSVYDSIKGIQNMYIGEPQEDIESLEKECVSMKFTYLANRLTETVSDRRNESETQEVNAPPLYETLNEYRRIEPDLLKSGLNNSIVQMPPKFLPVPNKPMFFDLALNHIRMPDLEEKITSLSATEAKEASKKVVRTATKKDSSVVEKRETEESAQQSLGGMVKGWFWGRR